MTTATATPTPKSNDLIGWMTKNNRAARSARFLMQFLTQSAKRRSAWNVHTWSSDDNASPQPKMFHSLPQNTQPNAKFSLNVTFSLQQLSKLLKLPNDEEDNDVKNNKANDDRKKTRLTYIATVWIQVFFFSRQKAFVLPYQRFLSGFAK